MIIYKVESLVFYESELGGRPFNLYFDDGYLFLNKETAIRKIEEYCEIPPIKKYATNLLRTNDRWTIAFDQPIGSKSYEIIIEIKEWYVSEE